MLGHTFGLLGFSYAVIGRRSNLMLAACRRDFFSATPICGKLWANSDDSNALIARSEAHGPQIQTG
jgi:hypothetical protein